MHFWMSGIHEKSLAVASFCLISMTVMFAMVRWLERVTA